jgi:hypothetical protein
MMAKKAKTGKRKKKKKKKGVIVRSGKKGRAKR